MPEPIDDAALRNLHLSDLSDARIPAVPPVSLESDDPLGQIIARRMPVILGEAGVGAVAGANGNGHSKARPRSADRRDEIAADDDQGLADALKGLRYRHVFDEEGRRKPPGRPAAPAASEEAPVADAAPKRPEASDRQKLVAERLAASTAEIRARGHPRWSEADTEERLEIQNEQRAAAGIAPLVQLPKPQVLSEYIGQEINRPGGLVEKLPFIGAVKGVVDYAGLLASAKRFESGAATLEDWERLADYQEDLVRQSRDRTLPAASAAIVAESLPWALEFAASGGLWSVLRKGGTKAAEKLVQSRIRKGLSQAVEQAMRPAIGRALVGGVGTAARAAVPGQVPRMAAQTLKNLLPGYRFEADEAGDVEWIEYAQGRDLLSAMGRSAVETGIEVYSETTGKALGILGRAAGRLPLIRVPVGKLTQLKATLVAAVMDKRGWDLSQATRFLQLSGYDGVAEEIGEERVAELLRAAAGLEPYQLPSIRRLVEEAGAFAATGGALRAAGALAGRGVTRERRQEAQGAEEGDEVGVRREGAGEGATEPAAEAAQGGAGAGGSGEAVLEEAFLSPPKGAALTPAPPPLGEPRPRPQLRNLETTEPLQPFEGPRYVVEASSTSGGGWAVRDQGTGEIIQSTPNRSVARTIAEEYNSLGKGGGEGSRVQEVHGATPPAAAGPKAPVQDPRRFIGPTVAEKLLPIEDDGEFLRAALIARGYQIQEGDQFTYATEPGGRWRYRMSGLKIQRFEPTPQGAWVAVKKPRLTVKRFAGRIREELGEVLAEENRRREAAVPAPAPKPATVPVAPVEQPPAAPAEGIVLEPSAREGPDAAPKGWDYAVKLEGATSAVVFKQKAAAIQFAADRVGSLPAGQRFLVSLRATSARPAGPIAPETAPTPKTRTRKTGAATVSPAITPGTPQTTGLPDVVPKTLTPGDTVPAPPATPLRWVDFLKSKGIGPIKTSDPRYPALKAEFDAQAAPAAFTTTEEMERRGWRPVSPGEAAANVADPIADRLLKLADALQDKIDPGYDPAVARQNRTARRERQVKSSYETAERLEKVQALLRAMAAARRAGTLPPELNEVTSTAAAEELLLYKQPANFLHRTTLTDLSDKLRKQRGFQAERDLLESLLRGVVREAVYFYNPEELSKVQAAAKNFKTYAAQEMPRIQRALRMLSAVHPIDPSTHSFAVPQSELDAAWTRIRETALRMIRGQPIEKREEVETRKAEADLVGLKIPGFFPTPPELAQRMVNLAGLQVGFRVLEPSAGKGDLADPAAEVVGKGNLDLFEVSGQLREVLASKGYDPSRIGVDFLEAEPRPVFDAVLMNPPFENAQDVSHVRHAYRFLKPGGRLVAIVSEGSAFRQTNPEVAFREWLDRVGGSSEKLPEGSFKSAFRSTGVAARLVVIDKVASEATEPTPAVVAAPEAPPAAATPKARPPKAEQPAKPKAPQAKPTPPVPKPEQTPPTSPAEPKAGFVGQYPSSADEKLVEGLLTYLGVSEWQRPGYFRELLEAEPDPMGLYRDTAGMERSGGGSRPIVFRDADSVVHWDTQKKEIEILGAPYRRLSEAQWDLELSRMRAALQSLRDRYQELREEYGIDTFKPAKLTTEQYDMLYDERAVKQAKIRLAEEMRDLDELTTLDLGLNEPDKSLGELIEQMRDEHLIEDITRERDATRTPGEQALERVKEIEAIGDLVKQAEVLQAAMEAATEQDAKDVFELSRAAVLGKLNAAARSMTPEPPAEPAPPVEEPQVAAPETPAATVPEPEEEATDEVEAAAPVEARSVGAFETVEKAVRAGHARSGGAVRGPGDAAYGKVELRDIFKWATGEYSRERRRLKADIAFLSKETKPLVAEREQLEAYRRRFVELEEDVEAVRGQMRSLPRGLTVEQAVDLIQHRIREAKKEKDTVRKHSWEKRSSGLELLEQSVEAGGPLLKRWVDDLQRRFGLTRREVVAAFYKDVEAVTKVFGEIEPWIGVPLDDFKALKVLDLEGEVLAHVGNPFLKIPELAALFNEARRVHLASMTEVGAGPGWKIYAYKGKEQQIRAIAEKAAKIKPEPSKAGKAFPKFSAGSPHTIGSTRFKTLEDRVKGAGVFTNPDATRYSADAVLVLPDRVMATDGRMMVVSRGDFSRLAGTMGTAYRVGTKGVLSKVGEVTAMPAPITKKEGAHGYQLKDLADWPDESVVFNTAKRDKKPRSFSTADTYRALQMLMAIPPTDDKMRGAVVVLNPDGTLGFVRRVAEVGSAEINVQVGGKAIVVMDPELLADLMQWFYREGNDEVRISLDSVTFGDEGQPAVPMMLEGESAVALLMPMGPHAEQLGPLGRVVEAPAAPSPTPPGAAVVEPPSSPDAKPSNLTAEELKFIREHPDRPGLMSMGAAPNVPDVRNWWQKTLDGIVQRLIEKKWLAGTARQLMGTRWGVGEAEYEMFARLAGGERWARHAVLRMAGRLRKERSQREKAAEAEDAERIRNGPVDEYVPPADWTTAATASMTARLKYERELEDAIRGEKPYEQLTASQQQIVDIYAPMMNYVTDFWLANPWSHPYLERFGFSADLLDVIQESRNKSRGNRAMAYLRRIFEIKGQFVYQPDHERSERRHTGPALRGAGFKPKRGDEEFWILDDRTVPQEDRYRRFASLGAAHQARAQRLEAMRPEYGKRVERMVHVLNPFDVDEFEKMVLLEENPAYDLYQALKSYPEPVWIIEDRSRAYTEARRESAKDPGYSADVWMYRSEATAEQALKALKVHAVKKYGAEGAGAVRMLSEDEIKMARLPVKKPIGSEPEPNLLVVKPVRDIEYLMMRSLVDSYRNLNSLLLFKFLNDTVARDSRGAEIDRELGLVHIPDAPEWGPLAGRAVPEPTAYALFEWERVHTGFWNMLWDSYLYAWKSAKVPWSLSTWGRQLQGIVLFWFLDRGHFGVLSKAPDAMRQIRDGGPQFEAMVKAGKLLVGWNHEDIGRMERAVREHGEDMPKAAIDFVVRHPDIVAKGKKVGETAAAANRRMGRWYELPEQVLALASYMHKLDSGMSHEEAIRSLWMYPNYGELGNLATWSRRSPLGAPFVAFTDQAVKIFARAARDRPIRLAALVAAVPMLNLASRLLLGVDDDEMELINADPRRRGLWINRFYQPLLPIRDEKGKPLWMDLRWVFPLASDLNIAQPSGGLRIPFLFSQPWFSLSQEFVFNADSYTGRELWPKDATMLEKLRIGAKEALGELAPLPPLVHKTGGGGVWRVAAALMGVSNETPARAVAREFFGVSVKSTRAGRDEVWELLKDKLGDKKAEQFARLMILYNQVYRRPEDARIRAPAVRQSVQRDRQKERLRERAGV